MTYTGSDFYCDVAIPNTKDLSVVYEDADILAYHHTQPHWETHIVCVPKKHVPSFTNQDGNEALVHKVLETVRSIAQKVEQEKGACRIITNLGTYQDSKHLHFHICQGSQTKKEAA